MRTSLIGLVSAAALALAGCGSESADTTAADTAAGGGAGDTAEAPVAGAGATPAAAGDAAMPTTAQGFVDAAAASDMFEIESSRMAQTMAKSPEVKSYAEMMIADHTASSKELKATAAKATPAVTVTPKLMPDQQASLDTLKAAGANFDTAYAQAQVAAHQKTLGMLQGYASGGDSEPLKGFAAKMAPKVSQHLEKARTLPK